MAKNAGLRGAGNQEIVGIMSVNDTNTLMSQYGKYLVDPFEIAQLSKLNMEMAGIKERQERIENGEIVLTEEQKSDAFKLQDDYESASKTFIEQVSAYNRIVASAVDPSAAGDLALIFNYMKLLDPGSVVREGEFANAQNAAGVPQRVRAMYNRTKNGQRLSEETRVDFLDRSRGLYESAAEQQRKIDAQFRNRSKQFGVPHEVVVRDLYSVAEDTVSQTTNATQNTQTSLESTWKRVFGDEATNILNNLLTE